MGLQITPPTTATVASMPTDQTIVVLGDDRDLSPEQSLWHSVVAQAWQDAFAGGGCSKVSEIEKQGARRWLTSCLEPWRQDREMICLAADIDPDMIRCRALKLLAGLRPIEIEPAPETAGQRNSRLNALGDALRRERRAKGIVFDRSPSLAKARAAKTTKRKVAKPKPVRWSSAQFFAWLESNQHWIEPSEMDQGLAFAAELEAAEHINHGSARGRSKIKAHGASVVSSVGKARGMASCRARQASVPKVERNRRWVASLSAEDRKALNAQAAERMRKVRAQRKAA